MNMLLSAPHWLAPYQGRCVGVRPRIVVRQFPPKVRTYLKSTTGNVWVPARTLISLPVTFVVTIATTNRRNEFIMFVLDPCGT